MLGGGGIERAKMKHLPYLRQRPEGIALFPLGILATILPHFSLFEGHSALVRKQLVVSAYSNAIIVLYIGLRGGPKASEDREPYSVPNRVR